MIMILPGHRRLGLGGEAWTDYLKFSGNYYHPLSDWKDSEDFDFYEERPARGWDIRAEAWLPSYPQLGAKLSSSNITAMKSPFLVRIIWRKILRGNTWTELSTGAITNRWGGL